jgi:hypothetical protein
MADTVEGYGFWYAEVWVGGDPNVGPHVKSNRFPTLILTSSLLQQ